MSDWKNLPEITATMTLDGFLEDHDIDARPHLATLDAAGFRDLHAIDWRGDYAADDIFHSAARAGVPEAVRLDDQIAAEGHGFEVGLEEDDVKEWLMEARPDLFDEIKDLFE